MDLLERFAAGDPDAFEILFRQHQGEVYGWIARIVRDPAAAEDLTLETFWRVHRAHHRFNPALPFGAWARRIATHVAIDHLRARPPEACLPDTVAAPSYSDPVLDRETRDRVRTAFQALPATLRAAASLALIEELPYEEIADALGTSTGAIKSRVFRAVRILRRKLDRLGVRP